MIASIRDSWICNRLRNGVSRFWARKTTHGLRAPVFILGCGHSGTSLLKAILDFHPAIHIIKGETNFMWKSLREFVPLLTEFRRQTQRAGCSRWLEKDSAQCPLYRKDPRFFSASAGDCHSPGWAGRGLLAESPRFYDRGWGKTLAA